MEVINALRNSGISSGASRPALNSAHHLISAPRWQLWQMPVVEGQSSPYATLISIIALSQKETDVPFSQFHEAEFLRAR